MVKQSWWWAGMDRTFEELENERFYALETALKQLYHS